MAHTYSCVLVHIVFSTKDRTPTIDRDLEERLFPYLGGILRSEGGILYNVNGAADHVHLLADFPAKHANADLVRKLKANSSKWIHETFPERSAFAWQRGYAAFSVSRSNAPAVVRYIDRQKEHHRKTTFRDEFVRLLERHGITPDERYLWT